MQYLCEIGKRIPEDISIISIDNTLSPYLSPPLTSLKMPVDEMAKSAVEIIMANQNKNDEFFAKTLRLSTKLIHRKSVMPRK